MVALLCSSGRSLILDRPSCRAFAMSPHLLIARIVLVVLFLFGGASPPRGVLAVTGVSPCNRSVPAAYLGLTNVLGWGLNSFEQLGGPIGSASVISTPTPTLITRDVKITKVSIGYSHVAILDREAGVAFVSGRSKDGELGLGPSVTRRQGSFQALPYVVDEDSNEPGGLVRKVIDISAGFRHTCAVLESKSKATGQGVVFCTGSNARRQLGNAQFDRISFLVAVKHRTSTTFASASFAEVHAGADHTVAVTSVGDVWSWGSNEFGQLGDGSAASVVRSEPGRVLLPAPAIRVCCGHHFCLALVRDANSTLYGWGANDDGQLGASKPVEARSPVAVLTSVLKFSCGQSHALAIRANLQVYSWGDGSVGALGQRPRKNPLALGRWKLPTPQPIPAFLGVTVQAVAAGHKHSVVLDTCGRVYTLGSDVFGQLGLGYTLGASTAYRSAEPVVNVPLLKRGWPVVDIFAGGLTSFVTTRVP